jgi:hypothetical protein
MGILTWLQSTDFSVWVREGESIWAFPTILTLHTFGLGILVGIAAVVNLRLLGIGRRLPLEPMRPLFPIMWGGFWVNAVTGTMLFMADAENRGTSLFFLAKMVFVAIGVATLVLIKRAVFDVPAAAAGPASARGLAILSFIAWTAAITAGRLLAYV